MSELAPVPSHVPKNLVYDFNYFTAPEGREYPHIEIAKKLHAEAPAIFYTPRNGGHWVVTRFQDGLDISRAYDDFSNCPAFNVQRQAYPRMAPIEYDPPEHAELRKLVNPAFTPTAILKMAGDIRRFAGELIERVYAKGSCEFVNDIARHYPVTIFLRMANAPLTDREKLVALADDFTRAPDVEDRKKARTNMAIYLNGLFAARMKNPGDDLLSLIAMARLPDRELTEEERLGFATIAFFGGLDTVIAALSFIMYYLGKNPAQYARLVADPRLIERGLEDLIRVHSNNCTQRGVSHDCEYKGIQFKKGDILVFLRPAMGLDEDRTEHADKVDFDRDTCTHLAFGAGVHRCIGSFLARLEMKTFLQEWAKRIPRYTVGKVNMLGGVVWTPEAVPLSWDVKD